MPLRSPQKLVPDKAANLVALVIVDMIGCWDFPDGRKLLYAASGVSGPIASLKARCRKRGIPVIYANDNRGRWRSDFAHQVELSLACGGVAARITRALHPAPDDYFVLKPKHSAFFGTPLELLLGHLDVRRIILVGVACDQCVLATAVDAHMRDLEVVVPQDCVASLSRSRNDATLRHFKSALELPTTPSPRLRLGPPRSKP